MPKGHHQYILGEKLITTLVWRPPVPKGHRSFILGDTFGPRWSGFRPEPVSRLRHSGTIAIARGE